MEVNARRVVEELKELRALTGDVEGAQRVAFTEVWAKARGWLRGKLEEIPGVEVHRDAAGNLWGTLRGKNDKAVLVGGHIDSVPNGGWLDGCLNTLAGVEVLRRIAAEFPEGPPVTLRVVDWADEEGARFGRSLFGSAAFSGALVLDEVRGLKDKAGVSLADALASQGIEFERVLDAGAERENAAAYVELHIEQGPVLESLDLPLGVVLGTFGV
ncbi:MAG TPA: M20/M25/M40 family metallo-hydrolase, partial [Phycisphaerae bacterium]|nr:M20/M25/M40 family metallo-hydrolase [Phycisphaerae bacterium]